MVTFAVAQHGYPVENPVTEQVKKTNWESMNSRAVFEYGLRGKGFTQAQLEKMSVWELEDAYSEAGLDGKVPVEPKGGFLTKFKRTEKWEMMPQVVKTLVSNPEEESHTFAALEEIILAYEKGAKESGLENDLGGAIGFLVSAAFTLQEGVEPGEGALFYLAHSLRIQLDSPKLKQMKDIEKQKFYEFATTMGSYFLLVHFLGDEIDSLEFSEATSKSREVLSKFLGIDPSKVMLTENGLVKRTS